jgi:hypothetical protein
MRGSRFASFAAGPLGSYREALDMMNASIARMGLVFVTLASLGGCSACGPKFPKDKPPQIASVYITPKQPTVTADWPVSFKAVALSTEGVRFDPMHYDDEGYTVLWEATKLSGASLTGGSSGPDGVKVAMGAQNKNPVQVMVADWTLKQFLLRVTVTYKKAQYRASVVIEVLDPKLVEGEDRVQVQWTPGLAAVMLNGCELTGSPLAAPRAETHWELFEVSVMTPLGKNYTEKDCAREAKFAIAAPFQRLILNDKTPSGQSPFTGPQWLSPLWTDAPGDELDASDVLLWLPPDTLDLYVYNYTGTSDMSPDFGVQLNRANEVYGQSRVGIAFRIDTTIHGPSLDAPPLKSICSASAVGGAVSAGGLDVDIASERLNVVVLQGALPTGAAGWACPPFTGFAGRVIYLTWRKSGGFVYSETLAHELGHALGHVDASLGFSWEHLGGSSSASPNSQPQEGFEKSNIMHPKVFDIPRDRFTVGQGFRMNVDPMSWYQQAPGIPNRHPPRVCGRVEKCLAICPPLHRDVEELPVTSGPCKPSSSAKGESGP